MKKIEFKVDLKKEEIRSILLEAACHKKGSLDILSGKSDEALWSKKILVTYGGNALWIFDFLPMLEYEGLIIYDVFLWEFEITPKGLYKISWGTKGCPD